MSTAKTQSFVFALASSGATLCSHTTLQNGYPANKLSKHEFIGRVCFKDLASYTIFNNIFTGELQSIESAGGS
jgi:hypothetical protein